MRRVIAGASIVAGLAGCGGGGGTHSPGLPAIHAKLIATGFDQPMQYITSPSAPTLAYVIERPGRIKVLVSDVVQPTSVLDISGEVRTDGECGLLGITFDPNFTSNHYFYLHYNGGGTIESRIARFTMASDGLSASSEFAILSFKQTTETNHKGGSLNFGPDGLLYLAFGDGGSGNDPNNYAQDPTVFFGKVLRIDPSGDDFPADPSQNYAIPSSNPFVGMAGVRGEIWDFGVRNPFRWSIDPFNGALIIADVGQDAYEEIDYEPRATGHRNYGWRTREGLHATSNTGPTFSTPLTDPFFEYPHPHGEAIVGGFVYRGSALDAKTKGRYFYADYVSHHIESIPLNLTGSGEAIATNLAASIDHTASIEAALATTSLSGPVSISPDALGEIVICDLNTGNLIRLVK